MKQMSTCSILSVGEMLTSCSDGHQDMCKRLKHGNVGRGKSDSETKATQLEESEENTQTQNTRQHPRHMKGDKHDARQMAHFQSRSRSGETVDWAHRFHASTNEDVFAK